MDAHSPISAADFAATHEPEPALSLPPNQAPLHLKKPRARPTPRALLHPPLEIETILAWADAHHARTGSWPTSTSGRIPESSGDNWNRINAALAQGLRGLSGGSSVARLLAQYRGKRNRKALPVLTAESILAWADAHHARTGAWPTPHSGEVKDAPGETWTGVQIALAHGQRGLPGGSSLAQLLQAARGRRSKGGRSRLSTARILAWADAHFERTGAWPTLNSGIVQGTADETWTGLQGALSKGQRGLPGGSSLAQLLAQHRGQRNRMRLSPLSVEQILTWADAHHERTGQWPTCQSGKVPEAPEERWSALNAALQKGNRTLPGGSSLAQLLLEARGVRHHLAQPLLSEEQIVAWAQSYHTRQAHPPRVTSEAVIEAPQETWGNLDNLLRQGGRGLAGRSSLSRLLRERHPEWFSPEKPQQV